MLRAATITFMASRVIKTITAAKDTMATVFTPTTNFRVIKHTRWRGSSRFNLFRMIRGFVMNYLAFARTSELTFVHEDLPSSFPEI